MLRTLLCKRTQVKSGVLYVSICFSVEQAIKWATKVTLFLPSIFTTWRWRWDFTKTCDSKNSKDSIEAKILQTSSRICKFERLNTSTWLTNLNPLRWTGLVWEMFTNDFNFPNESANLLSLGHLIRSRKQRKSTYCCCGRRERLSNLQHHSMGCRGRLTQTHSPSNVTTGLN